MKGILFKPWKIQFIAEHPDIETQTRRVIKPQPPEGASIWRIEDGNTGESHFSVRRCNPWHTIKPRYQVGETVYIKEALHRFCNKAIYKLDEQPVYFYRSLNPLYWRWQKNYLVPMHCPEDAARYFIRILSIRAERLQEITKEAILAEGVKYPVTEEGHLVLRLTGKCPPCDYIPKENFKNGTYAGDRATWLKAHFAALWDSINKAYPWESNPWVWVYGFNKCA